MSLAGRLLNTAYTAAQTYRERGVPFLPAEEIEARQRCRLRAMVRHAYASVPFYRQAMDERGLRPQDFQSAEDLARLPLLDKATVFRDPDRFLSSCFRDRSGLTFRSGSGKAVRWDDRANLRQLAYAERDRIVLGRLAGQLWGQRQLFLLPPTSSSLDMRRWWDEHLWSPRRIADRHYVSVALPYEAVIEAIDAVRPQVVFSYGSYTDHFFRFLADRGWSIAPPKVWMYGGDMLSPEGREWVEKIAGCHVFAAYESIETGRVAFMCERCRGFHVNVDWCALRLVDEEGRTLPPGARGEVVVSNLDNRAMVLLNYRLGDWAVWAAEPCPCGRSLPVLERLEGRCAESIRLPDGRAIPDLVLRSLCKAQLSCTLRSQLVQDASGRVRWLIVPFANVDREEMQRTLLEKTRAVLGPDVPVTLEFVEDIPVMAHGKFESLVRPSL